MSQTRDTELLDLWQFDTRSRISPGIQGEYRRYLDEYRRTVGALAEATPLTLKTSMATLAERLAPGTQGIARRALRSFFGWAEAEGILPENPALAIRPIRQPETPVRTPGQDERDALVAATLNRRDRAIVECLFGSGMRRGELRALRTEDIDLTAGTVRVAKSKSGRPRTAAFDQRALDALGEWLVERAALAPDTDAVWVTKAGTQLKPDGLKEVVRRVSDRAGITFSAHDARRSFAVAWLEKGGSEIALQALAGWADIGMCARYVRMRQGDLALDEAARLLR